MFKLFKKRPSLHSLVPMLLTPTLLLGATLSVQAQLLDPTQPPTTKKLAPPEPLPVTPAEVRPVKRVVKRVRKPKALSLSSILIGDDRQLAVINGAVVRVGQAVSGATVLRIAESGVTVRRGGREFLVRMDSVVVKRQVKR